MGDGAEDLMDRELSDQEGWEMHLQGLCEQDCPWCLIEKLNKIDPLS